MDSALQQLSRKELIALLLEEKQTVKSYEKSLREKEEAIQQRQSSIQAKQEEITYLKGQVAQLQRMLFGQKRERFENPDQLLLPFEATETQAKEQLTEKIAYVRKKQQKTAHKGRVALPDHLPVEEVEIYPEGDLSEMVCIGKEITGCRPQKN